MMDEIDVVDVVPLMLFPIFSGLALGVFTFTINVFGGFDFNQVLVSGNGYEVTLSMAITIAAGGMIVLTNEVLDRADNFSDPMWMYVYYAGVILVFVSPVMYAFIPAFRDLLMNNDIISLGIYVAQNGVPIFVAWKK